MKTPGIETVVAAAVMTGEAPNCTNVEGLASYSVLGRFWHDDDCDGELGDRVILSYS